MLLDFPKAPGFGVRVLKSRAQVEELCRELGDRGRAGSVASAGVAGSGDAAVAELSALSMKEVRARAKVVGATAEQLEDAADSDDPKAALVSLVAKHEAGGGEGVSGPVVLGSAMAAGGDDEIGAVTCLRPIIF